MKVVRRVSALLIGLVFIVSGFLKIMDPVGSGLIVDEYFKFLGLRFLSFSSGFAGYCLALLETITGAALTTGVWRRTTALVSGIMLAFFTLLTLILLIANPGMECGCFGEAIHLTHFQSFLKNVILSGLWYLAFVPFNSICTGRKRKKVNFIAAATAAVLFSIHALTSIPPIDFTPYSPGTELSDSEDPMLSFRNADGEYCNDLALDGNVLIVSSYSPSKLKARNFSDMETVFANAVNSGVRPLLLVASIPSEIGSILPDSTLLRHTYFADRRDLMTLNRSNGGATLISDGLILTKTPAGAIAKNSQFPGESAGDATMILLAKKSARTIKTEGFLIFLLALVLL